MDIDEKRFGELELEGRIEDAILMPVEAAEMLQRSWAEMWELWTGCFLCMAHWPQTAAQLLHEMGEGGGTR